MLRTEIIHYLENEFLGPPLDLPHEIDYDKSYPPYKSLLSGMVFPQESEQEEDESTHAGSLGEDIDPLSLAHSYLTSSIGISICVGIDEKTIELNVGAAHYCLNTDALKTAKEKDSVEPKWYRQAIAPSIINIDLKKKKQQIFILENNAIIDVRTFIKNKNKIATISLINNNKSDKKNATGKVKVDPRNVLHRVSLSAHSKKGFLAYPKVFRSTYDEEEEQQRILYKDEHTFGIGHSCSVDWDIPDEDATVKTVNVSFLPIAITKGAISDIIEYKEAKSINLSFLASRSNAEIILELKNFIKPYKVWIDKILDELNLLQELTDEGNKIFSDKAINTLKDRLNTTAQRIEKGIHFLEKDHSALEAFKFANLAMLMQMTHEIKYREISKANNGYEFFERDHAHVDEFNNIDYLKETKINWRPFQLAYFLISAQSVVQSDHEDRDTVDLIWFATGGGKTEAYLLVSSFLIFYNKLNNRDHNCPEIIMRYTLSLLTQDQFIRSTRIITACEKIRRGNKAALGENEINIGLWIGGEGTPNVIGGDKGAEIKLGDLLNNPKPINKSPFIMGSCSWCGTNLVPYHQTGNSQDYGFKAPNGSDFNIFCPSKNCPFHELLPVQVIDELLYKKPPTFILATIDKFAQFAHKPQAANLLVHNNECVNLIIQDELHLISGPLGTITGVFEAAFDTMLRHIKHKPKYLAATATIRGAETQIQNLYARKTFTFPPSGVSHKDRFFSRIDEDDLGRLYLGILSQGHTAIYTTVLIAAAALQSTEEIQAHPDEIDGYRTLVIYHNAKKEKSKTVMLAGDDIPKRINVIGKHPRVIGADAIKELSADIDRSEAFEVKRRLEFNYQDKGALDIVPVTSMLSVGVDIPRLALMQVTGQPRQTSEFIQATSRVGRGDNPGLVLVNYIASNTRDRSHYEQFYSYVNSINRFVEPTSVTPGAEPALRRALPTVILILARCLLGFAQHVGAHKFKVDTNEANEVFAAFKERLISADPQEKKLIAEVVDDHLLQLTNYIKNNPKKNIAWNSADAQHANHIYIGQNFGDQKNEALWSILQSMRHVDSELEIKIT
ncbi:hypothetical protein N9D27_00545 [Gammaproteobacteria bacterium]|nr:hypothetical protein [Gammaproteobacteria bacterium]